MANPAKSSGGVPFFQFMVSRSIPSPRWSFNENGAAAFDPIASKSPFMTAAPSEQRIFLDHAAHGFVVQGDAADAAVGGPGTGLRLDLLGGEDPVHRGQQRVAVQQFQVPG